MNRGLTWIVLTYSLAGMSMLASTPVLSQEQNAGPEVRTSAGPATQDISGTWVAKMTTPMGEMEITYKLKVKDGKITGTQSLPFGDSPIVDGQVSGDTFRFVVELESFGNIQKSEVKGKIVGDTLELIPAFPAPPPGMGPGGEGPGGPPSGGPPSGGPPSGGPSAGGPPSGGPSAGGPSAGGPPAPGAAGGPGGAAPPFQIQKVVARRGTPTPSNRAPSVDYATLPHLTLPALRPVPSVGVANTPPMGWNSWNKFQTKIDDATVRGIADAMVSSGMQKAGYKYVVIDDGWQGSRDAKGVLSPNPQFPDMRALADYVHSKGLLIGIYSSPGPRTCGGFEGSYGHEEQDAKAFAAWGMDYLKYDWCSASRVWKNEDMQAVYQRMGDALKQTGRPIVYALCQYGLADVVRWGPKVGGSLWRTTSDISDRYASMAKIGFSQSDLAAFSGPGHWNDPDMLEVGNGGMSADEYKTHFSLWAMIAAPLIAGNDVRSMSPDTVAILQNSEVVAVDQDPLGAGGKRVSNTGEIEIWQKPLASGDIAIAIFNHSTEEMRSVVSWETLSIGKDYAVRDLWAHADRGTTAAAFSEPVPGHGAIVLRLHRIK